MKFVDIHTHADWNSRVVQIRDLSSEKSNTIKKGGGYSLGIHQWFVNINTLESDLKKVEVRINDKYFLATGECWLNKVCNTDIELLLNVFKR